MGSYGVSKVKYCLSLSLQKLPIPLEMSAKYWNCLQMSYFRQKKLYEGIYVTKNKVTKNMFRTQLNIYKGAFKQNQQKGSS